MFPFPHKHRQLPDLFGNGFDPLELDILALGLLGDKGYFNFSPPLKE